jgi:hypothetical protein
MTTPGGSTNDRIEVPSGEATITIDSLTMASTAAGAPVSVVPGATLHLKLLGTSTVSAGYNYAGIQVPDGAGLTVAAAVPNGSGKLVITIAAGGAGIGGGNQESAGTITIDSGAIDVSTRGMGGGAGIGGGSTGAGGVVTINGGTVTTSMLFSNSGIGGGYKGAGGTVTINGGTVQATATYGAGIGGGQNGAGGTVTINGGTVQTTATYGADIGGGSGSSAGGSLTVTGSAAVTPMVELTRNGTDAAPQVFKTAKISGAGAEAQDIDGLYDQNGLRDPGNYTIEQIGGSNGTADSTGLKVTFERKMKTDLDKAAFTVNGVKTTLKSDDPGLKVFTLDVPKDFWNGQTVKVTPVWSGWTFSPASKDVELFCKVTVPASSWPDGDVYVQGSGKPLVWHIDKDLSLAADVFLDGTELAPGSAYELSSGSTVVNLNPEFLDAQQPGFHTLKATFIDGAATEARFEIQAAKTEDIKTEDIKTDAKDGIPATGAAGDSTFPAGVLALILTAAGVLLLRRFRTAS